MIENEEETAKVNHFLIFNFSIFHLCCYMYFFSVIKMFTQNKEDRKRVEKALDASGMPSGKVMRPSAFFFFFFNLILVDEIMNIFFFFISSLFLKKKKKEIVILIRSHISRIVLNNFFILTIDFIYSNLS